VPTDQLLEKYFDGSLSQKKAEQIDDHRKQCSACGKLYEQKLRERLDRYGLKGVFKNQWFLRFLQGS